jgi:hypothetical protein
MDFKTNIVKPNTKSEHRVARIHYEDGKFYAELHDNSLYELSADSISIENIGIVYSTPENTNYCEWTPKKLNKILNKLDNDKFHRTVIMKYWSKYKEGSRVYGDLVTENGSSRFKTTL